jgi:hypothetical protein
MQIPEGNHSIGALIDKAHEQIPDRPRYHLGCSLLGHGCDRWLWLSFRWAVAESFSGRMLRLFRRGAEEEPRVVSDLRMIGVKVETHRAGRQIGVSFGSFVSGSLDGIVSDVPGGGSAPHVLEIKTHGDKSFAELTKKGVQKAKPLHYTQMQTYMLGTGLTRALYAAVNKNDDTYYFERVEYDKAHAERAVARGQRIALDERMPEPLSHDPTWYQCKMCPAHGLCHEKAQSPRKHCRNCFHATPTAEGEWLCEQWNKKEIPNSFQPVGCEHWVEHPDLTYLREG